MVPKHAWRDKGITSREEHLEHLEEEEHLLLVDSLARRLDKLSKKILLV